MNPNPVAPPIHGGVHISTKQFFMAGLLVTVLAVLGLGYWGFSSWSESRDQQMSERVAKTVKRYYAQEHGLQVSVVAIGTERVNGEKKFIIEIKNAPPMVSQVLNGRHYATVGENNQSEEAVMTLDGERFKGTAPALVKN